MSVERTSFLTAFYIFNCCSPLCVFRFLFDLTFIFQQQRVSERASLCVPTPYDRIIRTHSSVYLYGYTVTMILIRMKQRKKSCQHARTKLRHAHTRINVDDHCYYCCVSSKSNTPTAGYDAVRVGAKQQQQTQVKYINALQWKSNRITIVWRI